MTWVAAASAQIPDIKTHMHRTTEKCRRVFAEAIPFTPNYFTIKVTRMDKTM